MQAHAFKAIALTAVLAACVSREETGAPESGRKIIGPAEYGVDWDLPETVFFWVPKELEDAIQPAFADCKIDSLIQMNSHIPPPPQYSQMAIGFVEAADEVAKSCVMARLKPVPALTYYVK